MNKITPAFIIATILLLVGCATTTPSTGKIYFIGEKSTIGSFQIGSGTMVATNPTTGEKFEGTYSTVTHSSGGTYVAPQQKATGSALSRGIQEGIAMGEAAAARGDDYKTARGVLIGDRGTTIQLTMELTGKRHPHGHGDGTDAKGNRYQVQF